MSSECSKGQEIIAAIKSELEVANNRTVLVYLREFFKNISEGLDEVEGILVHYEKDMKSCDKVMASYDPEADRRAWPPKRSADDRDRD